MTDITELALLVSKAKASVFTLEYISQFEPADIDSDDVDLRFEVDGRDTGTNVSIVDECGKAAKVIGTLVEALEKAQRYIEELREWNAGLAQESFERQQRIAEMESRTVKLPDLRQMVSGDRYVWSDGVYNYSQDVKVVLAAAGIKVEAE
ncbi:TPA: ead/Ea22-like family protein [Klebsiella pneumoniae]|nr:ead/Ea22-like family protein [Klebsiella pneumoniae]